MSFTTRCPACGTTFRIVPDQLKISDGWVRCGHCADVFDATLFLEGRDDAPTSAETARPSSIETMAQESAAGSTVQPSVTESAEKPTPADRDSVVPSIQDPDEDEDWLVPPSLPQPEDFVEGLLAASSLNEPTKLDPSFLDDLRKFEQALPTTSSKAVAETPGSLPQPSAPTVAGAPVPTQREEAKSTIEPATSAPDEADELDDSDGALLPAEPNFVRQARRKAFWQSRGMHWAQISITVLLASVLLAQVLVRERDRIAAAYPSSVTAMETMCRALNCTIGPVRDIESVAIDSSNLVRRLDNFYSFDLVLRNGSHVAVAMPALELSLTDSRDGVISRRVFLPEELPGSPELVPPQGSLSLSLRLSIADKNQSSMSGYRALVFYP